jgi:deoxyadenosine/deoxycytidine kinase
MEKNQTQEELLSWCIKLKNENIQCSICVDSNIGGGKSTLLQLLSQNEILKDYIDLLFEPVEKWQNIQNTHNLLDYFYKDPKKYSYIFQTMTIITRMEMHDKANKEKLIIGERSWLTDRHVFVEQLYEDNILTKLEYDCYKEWYKHWSQKSNIDGILYLNTTPDECYRRKHNLRQRKEEESIPLSYLEKLHNRHIKWLQSEETKKHLVVKTVNGNSNFIENKEEFNKILQSITNLLKSIYEKKSKKQWLSDGPK